LPPGGGRSALRPCGPGVPDEGTAPASPLPVTPGLTRGLLPVSKRYVGATRGKCFALIATASNLVMRHWMPDQVRHDDG